MLLFYAAISLGLTSPAESQFNSAIWIDACFQYISKTTTYSNLSGNEFSSGKITPPANEFASSSLTFNQTLVDSIPEAENTFNGFNDSTFVNPDDSTFNVSDSLFADTVKVDSAALDSTARIKYFHYQREDVPYVKLERKKTSKFFAQPSQKTRTIQIDSTGKYVEIVEKVGGQQTKIILRMPIEEYIELRLALRERELWEERGYKYELKESQKGLAELIKDITDFEIPLPSVGVLSIFGEPKISLRIGGAVDIHGAWRSETTEGVTASLLGNTRNEPDFKQTVQINVSGTIGDKLNINADWNTERTFEYENQLKLKYTGYEDEIIQSIEAGNVSLQTSPLVGGSEALFGVKANFKMGPFSLTTIASQKKGEVKEVAVSGGSQNTEFTIRAYNYSRNHYFVDKLYADTSPDLNLFEKYYTRPTPEIIEEYRITDIEVWKSIKTVGKDPAREREANAYINLNPLAAGEQYSDDLRGQIEAIPGQSETGRFLKLTKDTDYILHEETGFITFKTSIQESDVIAVAYRVQGDPANKNDDEFYGEFVTNAKSDTQKLVLKLIKPSNLQPSFTEAWSLQLRNIYPVGGRNIKEEGFEFNIKYEIEGQEPAIDIGNIRLLQAFGLDLYDAANNSNPDNIFDFDPPITIIPETGEVIFPKLQPFGSQLPEGLDTSYAYNEIYEELPSLAQNVKIKDKWIMTGKYSGEASAVYQLGFNVVENSVRVTLNGGALTPGVDYTVDYNLGQLTIRNDAALVPGADLKITYEQNDLFQLASKTLLGARGIFDFSEKTKLGFSILNLNQQTLSDKVRIGEEPLSNTIMGIDFTTSHDLPFLTKGLDNIFSTKTMSSISLAGEYAYIDPDPNTKKSTIASDRGQSIAYIDDFEGTKRIIPVGVSYSAWKDLSPPDSLPRLSGLAANERIDYKAKSFWFTETPATVPAKNIWPNRSVSKTDQNVTVMDFVYLPNVRGPYNYNPRIDEDLTKNWGGMMKVLSSTASNLVEENIEFIEIWLQPDLSPGTDIKDAKIYVDLGRISEDVIPNRRLDTEDADNNDAMDTNGEEDTGLDGIKDGEERSRYPDLGNDPSADNYFLPTGTGRSLFDYQNVNNTEGNFISIDASRTPDTEDINHNGSLDQANSYFRYEIPLDTNASSNLFIAGGGDNDRWYLYRIPLKDFSYKVGDPNFSTVEFIRFFVTGYSDTMHVRIAEFNLVGSQWRKTLPDDSILSVSVINVEENPNYSIPPGVGRERDRTKPDEEIYRNEQSMNLIINGLEPGDAREVVKYLYRPLDIFNYKEMKLFVHGDTEQFPNSLSDTTGGYRSQVYFRFGADTNNYYEYRQPVVPDWGEIAIKFEELTAIKEGRDSLQIITYKEFPIPGKPGHFYRVKGNPSLTQIKFLSVGIQNIDDPNKPRFRDLSGQVWINELRVVGADDTPGWAYSLSGSLKMADILSVSFNRSETNPYFHKLSDRFGSREEAKRWGVSADLDVLKLLPFTLHDSNLKITYSHTENVGRPLYFPGTDVLVSQAAQRDSLKTPDQIISETENINISDTWTASNIKLRIPTDFWLIRDSFNALSFAFNYNKSFSRSPTVLSNSSWVWNASMNYGINLSPDYYFYPADIPILGTILSFFTDYRNAKVYYTPQNFSFNMNAKRNRTINTSRERKNSPSLTIISRDFTTQRGFNFSWKITEGGLLNLSTTYSLNINSSLAHLETYDIIDKNGIRQQIQRSESEIWNDIFTNAFFGKDYQYQQNIDFRTAPRLPSIWDLNRHLTITAGYSVGYQWQHDLKQDTLGRGAGYSSKASVGLTLRLKALAAPLFEDATDQKTGNVQQQGVRNRNSGDIRQRQPRKEETELISGDSINVVSDSLASTDSITVEGSGRSSIQSALLLLKNAVRYIFFDYDNITFNFSSDNQLSKSGIYGRGTGFNNFWGIGYNQNDGPSRGFMLGLSQDVGLRAPGGNLSDVFSQKNNFDFKTSRPLWEGAKIDLNWKVGWSINKTTSIQTSPDTLGLYSIRPPTSTGSLNRSFLALPGFFFIESGIKRVHELYNPNAPNPKENLSNAFAEGFEQFPILGKIPGLNEVMKYLPRPNWRISWDGLEKYFIFQSFAKRVSLDHAYTSTYSEGWKTTPDGTQEVQTQRVEYGFSPLAGINFTFNELWGGNLIASLKYGTKTSYDLGISTDKVTEVFSRDIGITAGYSKSGFEIPLFGISLKNDIEFSFSYTNAKNSTVIFDMVNFTEEGKPQDGTTRVTMEPRVKYTISSKVTLSIFYRRSTVEPEGAARIPPTTTNEAGLDVHISIQ